MANISSPEDLNCGVGIKGNAWEARLIWVNPVVYDKILIVWGPGTTLDAQTPSSQQIDSSPNVYPVDGVPASSTYVFRVKGGQKTDVFGAGIDWDYSDWVSILVSFPSLPLVLQPGERQLVSYSRSGAAFSAPIVADGAGRPTNGKTHPIGGWENDWFRITGINDAAGDPFLLLYRNDGLAWVAPIVMGQFGPQNGKGYVIGGWENDWTQVVGFTFRGQPYVLLYRQSKQPTAWVAPLVSGANGPQNGQPYFIGGWEQDWTQIAVFDLGGLAPYFFFYRLSDKAACVAPIVAGESGPKNDATQPLIGWQPQAWSQIRAFQFGGMPYLMLYRDDGPAFFAALTATPAGVQIGTPYAASDSPWEANWADFAVLSFL